MSKPAFKLQILEVNERSMMESTPRYGVFLNGERWKPRETIYYNMKGYRGSLPSADGRTIDIGEAPISAWKREVAHLNREGAVLLAAAVADQAAGGAVIGRVHETIDPWLARVEIVTDGQVTGLRHVRRAALEIGQRIFPAGVPAAFLKEVPAPDLSMRLLTFARSIEKENRWADERLRGMDDAARLHGPAVRIEELAGRLRAGAWGLRDVGPDDHGEDSLEVAVAALGPQATRDIIEIFTLAEEMGDEAPMEDVSRFHAQDAGSFWPMFAIAESLDLDDVPLPEPDEDGPSPD